MGLCCPNENNYHGGAIHQLQPVSKDEYQKLLQTYKYAVCKIITQIKNKEENEKQKTGTGFFCEINDKDIPFKKALFTNNHILGIENLQNDRDIVIEYLENIKVIKITENRKRYTRKNYDYTCIEIFESDNIKKFFQIDKSNFENKRHILKEIFILHYPKGKKLSISYGKIQDINNNIIIHDASTLNGSSGSALINRYNINSVFGIHFAGQDDKNLATPFDIIIKNIKEQINGSKKIKLIYELPLSDTRFGYTQLFGLNFVKNNRFNIKLTINEEEKQLNDSYDLKEGIYCVELTIVNTLITLEDMFYECESLKNIEGLEFLNTEEVHNFKNMFYECSNLSDLKPIKNWDVSKGNNFEGMFGGCKLLKDLNGLENWNVSNGLIFYEMFSECISLLNINGLKNWNISNGKDFRGMFAYNIRLTNLDALKLWNFCNAKELAKMFAGCTALSDINGLKNWNTSKIIDFSAIFLYCISLLDIDALKNWDVSNGINFSLFFMGNILLKDIYPLKNWNVSNGQKFKEMFKGCSSLSDIHALENWKVLKGKDFESMFEECILLSDVTALKNWNIPEDAITNSIFGKCPLLSNIKLFKNNVKNKI